MKSQPVMGLRSMPELFLIAHKVSGEAAFDVAIQMECPICHDANSCGDYEGPQCEECEGEGHWWIIPTSGHRAYPYHYWPWDELTCDSHENYGDDINYVPIIAPEMPSGLPDHYPTLAAAERPKLDLAALMKSAPIRRRV